MSAGGPALGGWVVERTRGSAAELHGRRWPDPVVRSVWAQHVERPAVVLGSAQRPEVVDRAAAERCGVDIVRRRSGGGAVLLVPGASTWIDVLIPAGDRRWERDVGRAFHWLGEAWRTAVSSAGTGAVEATVNQGSPVRTGWSDLICFAGLGTGEVSVDGRKLVGLSQRRTRAGARFQCIVHHRWEPARLLDLLALGDSARRRGRRELADVVATWPGDPDLLVAGFLAALHRA